jgi:ribosomal protein S18 acetylase RimI-like enzyme
MLLVDPGFRRMGVGTGLLQRAIHSLEGCEAIGLDATPAGKALYRKLGFEEESCLHRMTIRPVPPPPDPAGLKQVNREGDPCFVRPLTADAVEQVAVLDRRAFGADRTLLLRSLMDRDPHVGWQSSGDGRMRGFCMSRRGSAFIQLGPVVAETVEAAIAVCMASLGALAGEAVMLDVPSTQERFLHWLSEMGFADQRSFTRMFLGRGRASGTRGQQFVISGPELG